MLTETVSPQTNPALWWNETWKTIGTDFREIKSVLISPVAYNSKSKDSDGTSAPSIKSVLANTPSASIPIDVNKLKQQNIPVAALYNFSFPVKTVVYNKGYDWFRNKHTLGLETIKEDVEAMKKIGINTVERRMPGIYDHNLSKVLVSNNMSLIRRFWFLTSPEVVVNDKKMRKQKEKILEVIEDNLDKKYIIAWNLGDDVLHNLASQSYKPDYFYYRQKYLDWLYDVCNSIRQIDSVRPIIMDLYWDANGRKQFEFYKKHVPQINTYMLTADVKYPEGLKEPLEKGMAWGKVPVKLWPLIPAICESGTIPAWQDNETTDYVKLSGLLDLQGRKKQDFREVENLWAGKSMDKSFIPEIKILKPARVTFTNDRLTYSILYKTNSAGWRVFNEEEKNIQFEWYLVRLDQYGNTMFIKKVGKGPFLYLDIPSQSQYYKLYLEAVKGDEVNMVSSTLNTPFN